MLKQALIIYDSESGSTVQAAEIIKNEISKNYAMIAHNFVIITRNIKSSARIY